MVTAPILIAKAQCFTWESESPMFANFPDLMRFWWFQEAAYEGRFVSENASSKVLLVVLPLLVLRHAVPLKSPASRSTR